MYGHAVRKGEKRTWGMSGNNDDHVKLKHVVECSEGKDLGLVALHVAAGNTRNRRDGKCVALGHTDIAAASDAIPQGIILVVLGRLSDGHESGRRNNLVKGACNPGSPCLKPGRSREMSDGRWRSSKKTGGGGF